MNRVKQVRRKKGLRQIDLAEAAGVSLTWIWILENSQGQGVSKEIKQKVVEALNVELIMLFPDENGDDKFGEPDRGKAVKTANSSRIKGE